MHNQNFPSVIKKKHFLQQRTGEIITRETVLKVILNTLQKITKVIDPDIQKETKYIREELMNLKKSLLIIPSAQKGK